MHNQRRIERELQKLIQSGSKVDDAVREMHAQGTGILFLAKSVETVCEIPGSDAKRIVVKATFKPDEF